MPSLFLVRHGQASFGAANYDVLSELGHRQSVRLGEYFNARGITFSAALTGTLQRQIDTLADICEGMRQALQQTSTTSRDKLAPKDVACLPDASKVGAHRLWPGLNEYDSHALIAAIHPQPLCVPTSPEEYRRHFRLLKSSLKQWMDGSITPLGMPDYVSFAAGVSGALHHVRTQCKGDALIVSSGGPIATAIDQVLGAPPETTIELNLQLRNTSVTEFTFTPTGHKLLTYNTLPHLDGLEHAGWVGFV